MRGLTGAGPGGREGERGAVIPLVALSLVALLGMMALVVDVGSGWRTRRALIPATDAGALAAAQDFVNGDDGCATTAAQYVTANEPTATLTGCDSEWYDSDHGRVTVTATEQVETWFAPVIGRGDYPVDATTSVRWGPPSAVTGLRPIGLCIDGSAALEQVVRHPPSSATTIRISYSKDQPNACGGGPVPGNWGTIDFDGGANSNADTKDWVLNGYPGAVHLADHAITSCVGEAHCYEGDTGALAGINSELAILRASGDFFTLPVFDFAESPGANARFHLMGVLRVRLLDYKVNGPEAARFFELSVEPGLITGVCCDGAGATAGNRVIALCAVDPDGLDGCAP